MALLNGIVSTVFGCFAFIFYVLSVIGMYKVFEKMNIEGWRAIIPLYNDYLYAEKTWDQKYIIYLCCIFLGSRIIGAISGIGGFIGGLLWLVSAASFIFYWVARGRFCYWEAKAFGQDLGFAIGLLLAPFVFEIMLGYGEYRYQGNAYSISGEKY